jgi:hypothetical protein
MKEVVEAVAKAFSVCIVLAIITAVIWYVTDVKDNFKWYRKKQGGRWYKYAVEETDDYFWSDDWTLQHKIIEIEEY